MSTEQFTPEVRITMTAPAIEHTRKEMAKMPGCKGVRLSLETSGCSGYMYEISFVTDEQAAGEAENDQVFNISDTVTLFVNVKHLPILNGTEIDFVTKGLNSMFYFNNPNAAAECGCGESFSVV